MEVFTYIVIFSVIVIGAACIIFGQQLERYAGIVILFMMTFDILVFRIINGEFIERDFATMMSDAMKFSAFLAISLQSVKVWPTFCSGILLVLVVASTFKNFDLPIGIFGGDNVRIACHLTVYTAVSIGLWRNNTFRR